MLRPHGVTSMAWLAGLSHPYIALNFTVTISLSILLIVLLIHLEYNIAGKNKHVLKDKYSHDLGNILQAIHTSIDIFQTNNELTKEESSELSQLLKNKLNDAKTLIKEIRKL